MDALVRMENLPIAMESFGARPGSSVEVCKQRVRDSDAVVVIVAHRYGWVPPESDEGDGHRSITWLEVDEAVAHDKPVFAFLVDPDFAAWTGIKEQDRIQDALHDADRVAQVVENLRRLDEFKKELSKRVREKFTTPEDLAAKVVPSVAAWLQEEVTSPEQPGAAHEPPTRELRVVHPLQPAQHFSGRRALLARLRDWWRDPASPDRVVALVAHGGAGKTALAEQLLRTVRADYEAGHARASALVWSFYEDPKTEAFLEAAEELFCESAEGGAGGRLQRLERALSAGAPHLLVIDGLERVQSEASPGRARGELEDASARNLLRSIAAGLGRTRALITSRFRLPDLDDWSGAGFRSEPLDDLDREAAVGLLRAYGVVGDEAELADLAESVGRHALTLSVMGGFLRDFHGGDPSGLPSLDLDDAVADDPKAAKLHRLLQGYAKHLPEQERDLLVRLSTFPRGVSAEILGHVVDAGGEVAGTLIGCDGSGLAKLAERLVTRGLVFAYEVDDLRTWTAHPFLRDWFRNLLGVPTERVHEVVRSQLAPSLEARPSSHPTDREMLDRYEGLIECSLLAGHVAEAYELYYYGLGRFSHLAKRLGEYERALRILKAFAIDRDPNRLRPGLSDRRQAILLNQWELFATELGELELAARVGELELEFWNRLEGAEQQARSLRNSANCRLALGDFRTAYTLASEAISRAEVAGDKVGQKYSHAFVGAALHGLGEEAASADHFARATELEGDRLYELRGIQEATRLLHLGDRAAAREHTASNLEQCLAGGWQDAQARAQALLALCELPDDPAAARDCLTALRGFVEGSGHMELTLRSHRAAAELARTTGDHPGAISEAETGLRLAERCGYGAFAIELRISLAQTHLQRSEPRLALRYARAALDASTAEACQYAWGEADAAHLCAVAHRALNEPDLVERRARQALDVRERIGHPLVDETRGLLDAS